MEIYNTPNNRRRKTQRELLGNEFSSTVHEILDVFEISSDNLYCFLDAYAFSKGYW